MTWLAIAAMALITFMVRAVFLLPLIKYQPSEKFKHFLSFSSLAVLTSIWVPIVFSSGPSGVASNNGVDYLTGTGVAIVLSLARFHSLLIVVMSMIAFIGTRLLMYSF